MAAESYWSIQLICASASDTFTKHTGHININFLYKPLDQFSLQSLTHENIDLSSTEDPTVYPLLEMTTTTTTFIYTILEGEKKGGKEQI